MTVISYPIPAYSNVPIQPQFYQPRGFIISAISLGNTTTITTTESMDYVVGQLIRLLIPPEFGTRQLNGRQGYVIAILSSISVEVDIDSKNMNVFVSASAATEPQILAIGDINTGAQNAHGRTQNITYIPGSFINISPQ